MKLTTPATGTALAAMACLAPGQIWDTRSDTWVATDGLGRKVVAAPQVPGPRKNRTVGMFYFLWLGEHGDGGPYDITKILQQSPPAMDEPDNPLWGPLGAPHHWGESVFGYYRSADEWVLRKHAQMLSDAGVDTVFFDVTNNITYPRAYLSLCKVWTQVRKEGGKTPQIAFLTPFWTPANVVQTLHRDFYAKGLYKDLWFQWKGKPLILADPDLLTPNRLSSSQRVPGLLGRRETYGQTFAVDRPFEAVGAELPTHHSVNSSVTISLHRGGGPGGERVATKRLNSLVDNGVALLDLGKQLPPGRYYLELSAPDGAVGWWSESADVYAHGEAYLNGTQTSGDRTISVQYSNQSALTKLVSPPPPLDPAKAAVLANEIKSFFTFRAPQADYFLGQTKPDQWAWLEVSPQHMFHSSSGSREQMVVGVAQNAVEGKLGVLSNPRSHGRSLRNGKQPEVAGQDFFGRNFQEQWDRAIQEDPEIVFVTGWNEWVAGRFDKTAPFHGAGPVNFVDNFNHEFSRDIEPVVGGATDAYYYQLVQNVRRYKGARQPMPVTGQASIKIDGLFDDWNPVQPEFRDDRFDAAHRNAEGWGSLIYRDTTGRNDFVRTKAAFSPEGVAFFAEFREPLKNPNDGFPTTLWLAISGSVADGLGHSLRVTGFGRPDGLANLERWNGSRWVPEAQVLSRARSRSIELLIPRSFVGKMGPVEFKWTDNIDLSSDPLNLYRQGDTAPNGRFRYRLGSN